MLGRMLATPHFCEYILCEYFIQIHFVCGVSAHFGFQALNYNMIGNYNMNWVIDVDSNGQLSIICLKYESIDFDTFQS